MLDTVQKLIDYHFMTHRRVWDCAAQISDERFFQPLTFSVGSIHHQFVHTMGAENVWYTRLMGNPQTMFDPTEYPTREAVRARWDQVEADWRDYVGGLQAGDLSRQVRIRTSNGREFVHSILDIILHVCNHGTDHRAQIMAMLHTLGGSGVDQDYIFYLRERDAK